MPGKCIIIMIIKYKLSVRTIHINRSGDSENTIKKNPQCALLYLQFSTSFYFNPMIKYKYIV